MDIKTSLLLLSGLAWTIVYIDCIRIGFKHKTYAIPFWALALNISWEILHTILDYRSRGIETQIIINGVWAIFDIAVFVTFFRYGKKYFPKNLKSGWFYAWSISGIIISFMIQYIFIREYGLIMGGGYAAFLQNLLMSALFIAMLVQRNGSEGQSLIIAVSKWIGTMAPTLLFGYIGSNSMGGPNYLMFATGIIIAIVDLVYIILLVKVKNAERKGVSGKVLF